MVARALGTAVRQAGVILGAHPSREERVAAGRAARRVAPRSTHAELPLDADRPDPVALLEDQATTRVPELVPVRYGRMLTSPFAFYRGAALVMASDLAHTPCTGFDVQACGDAHLANFGVFASPERRLVFDVNDFDETLPGPWEWDVKRLAASVAVAGRERSFRPRERRAAVMASVVEYQSAMAQFASMGNLEVWYQRLDVEETMAELRSELDPRLRRRTKRRLAKAMTRDNLQAFTKLAAVTDGEPHIVADPPLVVPMTDLLGSVDAAEFAERMHDIVRSYRRSLPNDRRWLLEQYRFVDLARKVVGVGSVGTRAWIALFLGVDGGDPLFLQAKEAESSVLERFVGASRYENSGHRVVAGQRMMQAVSDILLGWQRTEGIDGVTRDYYFRQLRDWKGSADLETMTPTAMEAYARLCGWTLARAHARSGDRVAIAAYLGSSDRFARAVAEFAEAYADQNERDHRALAEAVAAGRVSARPGL